MDKRADDRIETFEDFWPYYLREHRNPRTRTLHYAGTALAVFALAATIALGNPWLLLAVPLVGYGFAWFAHYFVEKNNPATFRYPLWSLACDFRMAFSRLAGRIDRDLERAGVTGRPSS
jgi:hypothetical protein